MTHRLPNGIGSSEVPSTQESKGTPEGSVMSKVLRDEFTTKRYSPWVLLVTVLAMATIAAGLSSVLDLHIHLPAVVVGIVCGLLLYELVRIVVVRTGRLPRFRSKPSDSNDPSTLRPRP
jgi:hypothetical protein